TNVSLESFDLRHRRVLRRALVRGAPNTPGRTTDTDGRDLDLRRTADWRRGRRERAERLASDGRYGSRLGVGTRQLRRPRLVGGLSAPRSRADARPVCQ